MFFFINTIKRPRDPYDCDTWELKCQHEDHSSDRDQRNAKLCGVSPLLLVDVKRDISRGKKSRLCSPNSILQKTLCSHIQSCIHLKDKNHIRLLFIIRRIIINQHKTKLWLWLVSCSVITLMKCIQKGNEEQTVNEKSKWY